MVDAIQQYWLMVRIWGCSSLKKVDEQVGDGFVHFWQDLGFVL